MTTVDVPELYGQVSSLLESMGEDPSMVAAALRVEGIRGVRDSAVAHPVCWWLIRQVPDLCVVLTGHAVHASLPGGGLARYAVVVPLPGPVCTFVARFDQGQHPDLELWLGCAGRPAEPGDGYEPHPALSSPAPSSPAPSSPAPSSPAPSSPALLAVAPASPAVAALREETLAAPVLPARGIVKVIDGELAREG